MKLAELEHNARMKLADSSLQIAANAEEYRQRAIAWLAAEMDLDNAELQEIVSIHNVNCKTYKPIPAMYGIIYKAINLSIPEHKSIFLVIEEKDGQFYLLDKQWWIDNGRRGLPSTDLGTALALAADEWAKGEEAE